MVRAVACALLILGAASGQAPAPVPAKPQDPLNRESPQSAVIADRGELERWAHAIQNMHPDEGPPRPKHWGGYRVEPREIEFWQQGAHRLHDRIRYRKKKDGTWIRERLAP